MDLTTEHFRQLYANLWPHCFRSAGQSRIYRHSPNPFTAETACMRWAPVTYFDWASLTGCSDFSSTILVREEYEKLRGLLDRPDRAFRCLLLGQPSTGIKHCLYYILVHRLHHGLPTAFQIHADEYYLFDNTGAHRVAGRDVDAAELPRDSWGLTVCSPCIQPAYMIVARLAHVVIQTGLPRDFRTNDRLMKILPNSNQYIMALPSWDEMEAIGALHGWDLQRLRSIFDDWGPSIRVCKSLVTAPVDRVQAYHARMEQNVLEAVATGNLKDVAMAAVEGVDLPGVDSETPSSIFFYYDDRIFMSTMYGLLFRRVIVPGRITRQLLASAGGECPPDGVSRFYLTPYGY